MSNVVWINSGAVWRRRTAARESGFMADFEFEGRLERLFAQPPRLADGDAFARRVEARLDREWTLRRVLIGAAGLAGAVVALGQTLGSGALCGCAARPEGREAGLRRR